MRATASPTRPGSSSSGGPAGLPLGTAQNPQARVQISPRIINVAVRCSQHSPMFGQRALSQTVWRFRGGMMLSNMRKFVPPENRTFSHGGRAGPPGGGTESLGRMLNGAAISFDNAGLILPVSVGRDNLRQPGAPGR